MQYNSVTFLFCFLPLFLVVYYIFPKSWRMGILTLGSLIFYYYAGTNKILIMSLLLGTTFFSYLVAQGLRRPRRGWLLAFGLVVLGAVLVFFKCYDGGQLLPTGMSFYLFQMAAYLIEVYMQEIEPDRNLISYTAQTVMFPKVLMGPLMNPRDLQSQVREPDYCYRNFHTGLQDFILGLALKVLLANRVRGLWAQAGVLGYASISTPFAWLALIAYAMNLYFDFWGYSLMARGIGHMLGFYLPANFLDPYASRSVSEFWRRWHATLGTWFREYLYIPLGGNRKGTLRTLLNLLVVWVFTGLWHGVGGNYLLWAMILFFFVVNERLWLRKLLKKSKILCHVYTVLAILISWIPFAIGDWDQMMIFAGKIFGCGTGTLNPTDYLNTLGDYFWLLMAGVFMATPLPRKIWSKIRDHGITDALLFVLFWVCVFFIATSAQDPFAYFAF